MPLLSIDYINQCFLLDFMLKIDKKKLPLHESHFVKATAPKKRIKAKTDLESRKKKPVLGVCFYFWEKERE